MVIRPPKTITVLDPNLARQMHRQAVAEGYRSLPAFIQKVCYGYLDDARRGRRRTMTTGRMAGLDGNATQRNSKPNRRGKRAAQ